MFIQVSSLSMSRPMRVWLMRFCSQFRLADNKKYLAKGRVSLKIEGARKTLKQTGTDTD